MITKATTTALVLVLAGGVCAQAVRLKRQPLPDGRHITLNPDVKTDTGRGSAKRAREFLKLADESLSEKRYRRARIHTDKAAANIVNDALRRSVLDRYTKLEHVGREMLNEAKSLEEAGKPADALREYRAIIARFGKLPCAERARKAFIRLKDTHRGRRFAAEDLARALLTDANAIVTTARRRLARDANGTTSPSPDTDPNATDPNEPSSWSRTRIIRKLNSAKQIRVITALQQVARRYPGTETGGAALDDLLALKDDEAFWKAFTRARRRERIKDLYQQGKALEKAGARKAALRKYRELMRIYPDSPYARVVRERLGESPTEKRD